MVQEAEQTWQLEDQLLKAAIDLLVASGEQYATAVLLSCGLRVTYPEESWWSSGRQVYGVDITLTGPPALYQVLRGIKGLTGRGDPDSSRTADVLRDAFEVAVDAVMEDHYLYSIGVMMEVSPPFDGWRDEYLAQSRGDDQPQNQAVVASQPPAFLWNRLRFRSKTELVLAQAFSRSGVLYFPLPAAVSKAYKLEPDFVVCDSQGKWGILEVHGDSFHPPETAAREHERGRWFKERGVKVFEVYGATECYNDPDGVVQRFLRLLAGS